MCRGRFGISQDNSLDYAHYVSGNDNLNDLDWDYVKIVNFGAVTFTTGKLALVYDPTHAQRVCLDIFTDLDIIHLQSSACDMSHIWQLLLA